MTPKKINKNPIKILREDKKKARINVPIIPIVEIIEIFVKPFLSFIADKFTKAK